MGDFKESLELCFQPTFVPQHPLAPQSGFYSVDATGLQTCFLGSAFTGRVVTEEDQNWDQGDATEKGGRQE